jgi:hypothetical protein
MPKRFCYLAAVFPLPGMGEHAIGVCALVRNPTKIHDCETI